MATTIESVTIGTLEKRVLLSNSQIGRVMSIGSNWTRLRVGCRVAVDDTGANITNSSLYIGVMSAPTAAMANGPLGSSGHFVGLRTLPATSWTRTAGPPVSYGPNSNSFWATKVNGTVTTAGSGGTAMRFSAAPSSIRRHMIVEIVKGTPNFTLRTLHYAQTGAVNDGSLQQLINAMSFDAIADADTYLEQTVGGTHIVAPTSANGILAVDEATNGSLVAICVAWTNSVAKMHVSEMMWAKMA